MRLVFFLVTISLKREKKKTRIKILSYLIHLVFKAKVIYRKKKLLFIVLVS